MRISFAHLSVFCFFLGVSPVLAQQDLGLDLLKAQTQAQRLQHLERGQQGNALAGEQAPTAKSPVCFDIHHINITGVNALPASQVAEFAKPYRGTCMGQFEIEALITSVKNAYIKRGLITTQLVVPPQDLKSGTLNMQVVEGMVERLEYYRVWDAKNTARPATRLARDIAFPYVEGYQLNLRDIEQGIAQINRNSASQATVDILPGTQVGTSVVRVIERKTARFHPSFGFDTRGSKDVGHNRIKLGFEMQDAIYPFDAWNFTYSGTRASNALAGSVSLPLGYFTLQANGSYSEQDKAVSVLANSFSQTGTGSVAIDRVMYRDQNMIFHLNQSMNSYWGQSSINAARLTPQRFSWLRSSANVEYFLEKTKFVADVGVSYGLPQMAGGSAEFGGDQFTPRANFKKLDAALVAIHSFGEN